MMYLLKSHKILPFLAFFFGLALPFGNGLNSIVLGLFYITVLLLIISKKLSFQKENTKLLYSSSVLLFLPVLWSFIAVDDVGQVVIAFERRLSFLLSPVAFLFLNSSQLEQLKNKALNGLLYGALAASTFLLVNLGHKYFSAQPNFLINNDLFNYFHTGFNFTKPIDMHPSYLGIYVLLALALLLKTKRVKAKRLKVLCVALLSITVFFLNSRIVLGLFGLLILIYLWQILRQKIHSRKYFIISFCAIIVLTTGLFVGLFNNTYLYQKLTKELIWELSYQVGTNYNSKDQGDSRLARWYAIIDLVKEKPLLGYGVSNESQVLKKQFLKRGMLAAMNRGYNSHNQFLGFAIEGGLIALFLMCFYLGSNLIGSLKKNDLIGTFFFISIISICVVENYMVRNAGITYLSFFGSLIFFSNHLSGTPKVKSER